MSNWPAQKIQEIADGIFTVIHGNGEVGVSNASFIIEGKRALVVDTMTFPEMTENMAHEIARHGAHVETVLNTHHHVDHMGGNKLFADAQIFSHPDSIHTLELLGFPTKVYDRIMPQFSGLFDDLELVKPVAVPEPYRPPRGGELHSFKAAHTAADTAVWFPESRVLLAGDISFIHVVPLSVNGFISGWISALDSLIALNPAVVVPGHGPVGTREDLVALRNYFGELERIGHSAVAEQVPLEAAFAQFDPGLLSEWIESERHEINLERVMQEARGDISPTNLLVIPRSAIKR
jgi:cyclase